MSKNATPARLALWFLLFVSFSLPGFSQAVGWNFSAGTASPSATAANITCSDLVQGNNNGTTTFVTTTSASSGYTGSSGTYNAGLAARTGALNIATGGSPYIEFTLTPDAGYYASVTSINFGVRSTSTGPQAYSIRTSLDNFGSDVVTGAISANSSWSLKTNAGLSIAGGVSAPLTIRIYGYNGSGSASANTANFRFDDIAVGVSALVPAISSNADLSALSLSAGSISPAFSFDTYSYSLAVPNAVSSTTISYTTAESHATVAVSLNSSAFGSPSGSFNLSVGANTLDIKTTAQDGVTTHTYSITINRAAPATPVLLLNSVLADFGNVCINGTPSVKSFSINGSDIAGSVTVAGPSGFAFSTSSSGGFANPLSFSPGSNFTNQVIYVQFSPSAIQAYDGNITVGSTGATDLSVAVTGSGYNQPPDVSAGTFTVKGTTVVMNGILNASGCTALSSYGFEYSTSSGFTNGTGIQVSASNLNAGVFSATVAGLDPNVTYYVKAFAVNNGGAGYSSQSGFTTSSIVPLVIADQPLYRYTEAFADISNWAFNFTSGVGANHFGAVAVNTTGSIPDGKKVTVSSAAFSSGTSGGVQKGAGALVLLSTGSTDNSSSVALDYYLDFTGVNAGTVSFDWASVNNSTGNRNGSLRVYATIDGINFTELTSADVINITNNIPSTGTVSSVQLPAMFNNNPNARIRFYYYNGTGGVIVPPATSVSGSRPKISIDNLTVTGISSSPCATPAAAATGLQFSNVAETSLQGSFTAASPAPNEYLVIMSENNSLTSNPVDGQTYSLGDNVGDGTVIGKGTDLNFSATDLTGATNYYFFVFSVNSVCTGGPKYQTDNILTGNVTTQAGLPDCAVPVTTPTNLNLTSGINTVQGSFTASGADEYLVLQSTDNTLTAIPVTGTAYNVNATIGNAKVVYKGNLASFAVNGLIPATTYYYFVFPVGSQACVNGPAYNTSNPLTASVTTLPLPPCSTPIAQASDLSTNASNSSITATFNSAGPGYNYLVIISQSPTLSAQPQDNTDYTPGTSLGGGTVISNNTTTSFIANNLNDTTTYYLFIYAANENCTGGTKYLLASPLTGSATTTNTPPNHYYFGNLHAHSDYSDGNKDHPGYTPADDYNYALGSMGMDFLGISEHNHFSSPDNPGNEIANYHLGSGQATSFTAAHPGFLAMYGMEWGVISGGGHVVVYGDGMNDLFGWESNVNGNVGPNYDVYVPKSTYTGPDGLFKTVNDYSAKNTFAILAHPNNTDFNNLSNIPYDAQADSAISGVAVESGPATSTNTTYSNPGSSMYYLWYYQKMLTKGYHLGPTIDHDNHNTTFGRTTPARTAVIAPELTQSAIMKAVKDMHFYATEDVDAQVDFTINTRIMGSIFEDRNAPAISVTLTDPSTNTSGALIRLMFGVPGSGIYPVVIDSVYGNALSYVDNALPNHTTGYYYIDITNGSSRIVTAPIWYTRTCAASSDTTANACKIFNWYGTDYTTSGTYTRQFTTVGGCDSVVTLHLTISQPPASALVAVNGPDHACPSTGVQLTASVDEAGNGGIAQYHWLLNGSEVGLTATASFQAFSSGAYVVVAENVNHCSVISSDTVTVTVADTEAPVINLPQGNITRSNDPGACGAIVSYSVSATDNCGAVTIQYSQPSGSFFPVGTTTVTVTATDASGNQSVSSFTVTVTDDEKPTIIAPGIVSMPSAPGQCGASINFLGNPVVSDNCGVASVTNDHPSAYFPVGTTVVTWSVTDIHGNVTDTAKQEVTVIDNELPAITVADLQTAAENGICGANITLATPVTGDNCGVASVTNDHPSTFFPTGTTNVVWTVTDVHGWHKSVVQHVTVTDEQAPVITPVPNQTFCATGAGNYIIPALAASDNCSVATISYTVTGATNRSGTGNNASGTFAIGLSTINWTVTDASGNTSHSTTQVQVNIIPAIAYTVSDPNTFCNALTLTAGNAGAGAVYNWQYGTVPAGSGQVLQLGLTDADGTYSLTATVNGCTSAPVSYLYQKQKMLNNYTILAQSDIDLGDYNIVASGSVGVIDSKGSVSFRSNSSVASPGSFVKAARIDKKGNNIQIANPVYSPATGITLPTMYLNTATTNRLPNKEVAAYSHVTVAGDYKNLTIHQGAVVTLTGSTYGTIRVEQGAQVSFTQPDIQMDKLQVVKGPRNGYSYVRFSCDTRVRVSGSVQIGSQVYVNPDNYQVTFYLGDTKKDDEQFTINGGETHFTANIYLPQGQLKVTGGYSYGDYGFGRGDCDRDDDDPRYFGMGNSYVYMTGVFIAEEIVGYGKNVIWNSFHCGSAPVTVMSSQPAKELSVSKETVEAGNEATALQVTVMPNPSSTSFKLQLRSRYTTPVDMRVMDSRGRIVESKQHLSANGTVEVGWGYAGGTYFAEFVQGNQRKTVQLIKIN